MTTHQTWPTWPPWAIDFFFIVKDVLEIRDRIVRSPTTKLCTDDIKNLKSWNLSVDASLKKDLHKEGIEELIFLGERMLDRHPSLLQEYHHSHYIFRATDTQRALVSGESFALGTFLPKIYKSPTPFENRKIFEKD